MNNSIMSNYNNFGSSECSNYDSFEYFSDQFLIFDDQYSLDIEDSCSVMVSGSFSSTPVYQTSTDQEGSTTGGISTRFVDNSYNTSNSKYIHCYKMLFN